MPSLQEALSAAIAKTETVDTPAETPVEPPAETPAETPETETAEQKAERLRDEKGRFARAAEKTETPETETEVKPARTPPKSWKKDYHEHYGKLDPALQEYIAQREEEAERGIMTYAQKAKLAEEMTREIAPYEATLRALNATPAKAIGALLAADHRLRYDPPAQKLAYFAELARQYGVDLSQLQEGAPQIDPTVNALYQEINALKQHFTGFATAQQQQTMTAAQTEIQRFAQGKDYFEDVRNDMALLIEAGRASGLEDAYKLAIRLNPEIHAKIEARQRAESERTRLEEAAKAAAQAKAKAVQVSGAPTQSGAVAAPKGDIRSHLEHAFSNAARV